ncbi:MAG: energy transducer TonB [Cyclobacteriaceae bacterium]|nr:energy transducer TonB [Cyclobacteriaceae bacterium]
MNHKIKVMHKEHITGISDEEIRGLMDFDGLVLKASRISYGAKILGQLKLITGGLAAISVLVFLIWNTQNSGVPALETSTPSALPASPPPAGNTVAIDSVIPLKEVPAQRPTPINQKPKENSQDAHPGTEAKVEPTPEPSTSTVVYMEAEPINGFPHLYAYFEKELAYPEEAIKDSVEGIVTAAFIITSRGQVDKITVLNSLGPAFDAEAIRLISNMPPWKPASIDGKPVATRFALPLNFQFNRKKKTVIE